MKIFLQYDWQIDNDFFKKVSHGVYSSPGTQEGGGPEQGFRGCFTDGVNQTLISSARTLMLSITVLHSKQMN